MNTPISKIILVTLLIFSASFSQKNPTTYPYGGKPDKNRKAKYLGHDYLNFDSRANFIDANFDSIAYFRYAQFHVVADFRYAQFHSIANFKYVQFQSIANFSYVCFDSMVTFRKTHFLREANFVNTQLHRIASFIGAKFHGIAYFREIQYRNKACFGDVQFDSVANFDYARFYDEAIFNDAQFHSITNFRYAQFHSKANFIDTRFHDKIYFRYTHFHSGTDFTKAQFEDEVFFDGCSFKDTLILAGVRFDKDIDLRRSSFDSIKAIYVDHSIIFPDGKFRFYWDQFKGRIKLYNPPVVFTKNDSFKLDSLNKELLEIEKILPIHDSIKGNLDSLLLRQNSLQSMWKEEKARLDSIYNKKINLVRKEHYQRIETFYHKLRDNFIAQGDKSSADAVMYELGWQKKEILGGLCQTLYGWLFGWGYQPWRYLLFVVLPTIIIFACIWYFRYYGIIAPILNKNIEESVLNVVKKSKTKEIILAKKIRWNIYDHDYIKNDIGFIYRVWHVLYFSAAVLIGIRWKKEWSDVPSKLTYGYKSYAVWLSIEYLLGLGLYVAFCLSIESTHFGFIKEIL